MNVDHISDDIKQVFFEHANIILIHNGQLSWQGERPANEVMEFIRQHKKEFTALCRTNDEARRFADYWSKGFIEAAIEVAIMANLPCYEDGIHNAGVIGWKRVAMRYKKP